MITVMLPPKDVTLVMNALKNRINRLSSMRWPLLQIAKDYYDTEKRWFATSGSGTWKPLSPRYLEEKSQAYAGRPVLVLTGRMRDDFTGKGRRPRVYADRLTLDVRPSTTYWRYHEHGSRARKLPERNVTSTELGERRKFWHLLVTDWLSGKVLSNAATVRDLR